MIHPPIPIHHLHHQSPLNYPVSSPQGYGKESLSFFIATIICIALVIIFPELTLFVPNLMFGK
jgi:TRAP-type C4-dicarboxylate transport system permease large subunit